MERIKLTKPQQRMYDRLAAGERIVTINRHYMSGGKMVWEHSEETAGYRVFINLICYTLKLTKEQYYRAEDRSYGFPESLLTNK